MALRRNMAEVSPKSFLSMLQKSGLCDADELKATVGELFEKAGGRPINLQQLTNHLVESDFISPWHVKKLTAGKYKGFFLGKYKLWQHLGTGGMSTVYLARHTIFNQMRAIKVLPRNRVEDKTFLQRFYREGRAAAALNHQNIVRVYDIGEDAETHYLVMEYVKGKDISVWVKESGPLPYEKAIDCIVQALTGLQHAHENDLIHRDIKPANLLVSVDGIVKVLDLGLVLFQEEDASLTVLHDEKVLGTADYLSPEQAIDSHKIDPRSDIYSMGCTLYFMLTGKPPFPNGTIAQRIAMHQSREPAEVKSFRPDCPDGLVDVLHKMMRKDPAERFQNCEVLIQALRAVGDELLSSTPAKAKNLQRAPAKQTAKSEPKPPRRTAEKNGPKSSSPDAKPATTPARKAAPASKPKAPASKPKAPASKPPAPASKPPAPASKPPTAVSKPKTPVSKPVAGKPSKKSPTVQPSPLGKTKEVSGKPTKQKSGVAGNTPKMEKRAAEANKPTQKSVQKNKRPNPAKSVTDSDSVNKTPLEKPLIQVSEALVKSADPGEVSVVTVEETSKKQDVGVTELQSFVTQNRPKLRQSAKPERRTVKEQAILAGVVIGMLALLGAVLVLAMQFAS